MLLVQRGVGEVGESPQGSALKGNLFQAGNSCNLKCGKGYGKMLLFIREF